MSIIHFNAGNIGDWSIKSIHALCGESLLPAKRLQVSKHPPAQSDLTWTLKGSISNLRYTTRSEKTDLDAHSLKIGRPECDSAAMIPIKKNAEWWQFTQDERRKIFEEDSKHIALSMPFLPFISRQLHHSRDLGQPFDFVTWFEFKSGDEAKFDELLLALRDTLEWKFVEREVDIRLSKR